MFIHDNLEIMRIWDNPGYIILHQEKFPKGAWCNEGEFVIYGRYAGSRFQTKYGEHRILNDDEIIGTIGKPEDILHLF